MFKTPFSRSVMMGALGALLCGTGAMAQGYYERGYDRDTETVVVRPDFYVQKHRTPGFNGDTEISVSRRISFADLDLSRARDWNRLEHRIHDTARMVCREANRQGGQAQLSSSVSEQRDCVRKAMTQALNDVQDFYDDRG